MNYTRKYLEQRFIELVEENNKLKNKIEELENENKSMRMKLNAIAYRYDKYSAPNGFIEDLMKTYKERGY